MDIADRVPTLVRETTEGSSYEDRNIQGRAIHGRKEGGIREIDLQNFRYGQPSQRFRVPILPPNHGAEAYPLVVLLRP